MLQNGKNSERQCSLADDVILSYDHKFRVLSVSPNIEEKLGYKPEELIGKSIQDLDIIFPIDHEKAVSNALKVLSGEAILTVYQFRTKDGKKKYGEVSGLPLVREGKVASVIIVAREVNEKHKDIVKSLTNKSSSAEAELSMQTLVQENGVQKKYLEEKEGYRIHFSLANDAMFTYDRDFKILSVSHNVERLIGYKPEEIIGKNFHTINILHPDYLEKAATNALRILSGERVLSSVYRFIKKNGDTIFVELSGVPLVRDGITAGVICVARDVNEWILSQEELKKHRDNLETLVKERTAELMRANERLKQEIIEHIQLENALRLSEEKYRLLVDNANEAIFIAQDDKLRFVNPKTEEITGYSREELTSRSFEYLIHPNDRRKVLRIHYDWMEGKQHIGVYKFRILDKNGNVRHVQINAVLVPWEGRNASLTFLWDITEQKRMEEQIRLSEKKFSAAFHENPTPMAITELETGRIMEINKSTSAWSGYTHEELIRHTSLERGYWMDFSEREDFLKELFEKGAVDSQEKRIQIKNGEYRDIVFSSRFIEIDGKTYVLSQLLDITTRKKAEDALQERERLFRAVFDQTFQFLGLLDVAGTIIRANQTALQSVGIEEADVIGKSFWETVWWKHSPDLQEILKSAIKRAAGGELVRFEVTHPAQDGTLRYMDFSLKPARDKEGRVVLLIPEGRDITERKQAEEELRSHQDHLESLVKERTAELVKAIEWLKQEIDVRKQSEAALTAREAELKENQEDLKEMNTTLKVMLKQRDRDKADIEANVLKNINETVIVYLDKLGNSGLKEKQKEYLSQVYCNLKDITSSFVKELSSDYFGLSPKEIQVASLIEEGKSSKEVAEFLNVSLNTIIFHRHNIRRKTGLKKKKINLTTYLKTLKHEHP